MSRGVTRPVYVATCDEPDCCRQQAVPPKTADADKFLEIIGWEIFNGRDRCPICADQQRQRRADAS